MYVAKLIIKPSFNNYSGTVKHQLLTCCGAIPDMAVPAIDPMPVIPPIPPMPLNCDAMGG